MNLIPYDQVQKIDGELVAPVPGYVGLYSASAGGRIWAHPRKSRSAGRWLKEQTDSGGYRYVCLFRDNARKYPKVHRAVLEAFSGGSVPPLQVNHINGDKSDNRLCNLEWVTASQNRKHAWATGLQKVSPAARRASSQNITNWNKRNV